MNTANFFERSLSQTDSTLACIESCQLCPGRGVVPVQFDNGFEGIMGHLALVPFEGHESDQKVGRGQIRARRQSVLASPCGTLEIAPVERIEARLKDYCGRCWLVTH